jgi:pilus assembly protein CpaB
VNIRRITIIAAIAFALGSGLLVLFFLISYQQANSLGASVTRVLVANSAIAAHAPLSADMFAEETRFKTKVDPDVVIDPGAIAGQVALIDIPAGAILTGSKMGPIANLGLSFQLKPGQRAMSISVDPVKDVSGFIQPGDRVDVLAQGPAVGNEVQPTVTILRGIVVLGMGVAVKANGTAAASSAENVATVTLVLTPMQADTLMTADLNAVIRLALRSPNEPLRSAPLGRIVYANPVASGIAPPQTQGASLLPAFAPTAPIAGTRPPSSAVTPTINGVTVIEGSDVAGSPR